MKHRDTYQTTPERKRTRARIDRIITGALAIACIGLSAGIIVISIALLTMGAGR